MAWQQLPVRKTLSSRIWAHVRNTFPNITEQDAIDYALKKWLKSEGVAK